jgi:hypothetical protein
MNKKKNILNLFTQDTQYNYHVVKTTEPDGHLVYLMRNGLELNTDSLEFKPTSIAEELVKECDVKIEKFAPSIFFTEETDTDELKIKLNFKLYDSKDFSNFIEEVKDEYRILEVKDSMLYKNDPESYKASKQKEHDEHQKELFGNYIKQLEEKKKKREDYLIAYNNDLTKLLKEHFESVIEYEKRDFNFHSELEKLLGNLVDDETWIKVDDKPFSCNVKVCSIEQDKMNVFLTDKNEYSFTATLRFDKTLLLTENIVKINKGDSLPKIMQDFEVLSQIYDINTSSVNDWEFKNDTDKIEYIIDYLVPIFKLEKDRKQEEYLKSFDEDEDEDLEKE